MAKLMDRPSCGTYPAVLAAGSTGAFRLARQFARYRIAAGIDFVAFLDGTAVAHFSLLHDAVSAVSVRIKLQRNTIGNQGKW